jgi:acetoin utilization protein AcuB
MFVSDWMTKKVHTVGPEESITKAITIMKEKKIKHLPVVKNGGKVVGILSDRDIKDYTPSKATTLDIHELHYMLAKTKVKDVMVKDVFTTTPGTPIEEASMFMFDKNIGCLPVTDEGKLAGIISDRDLFRVLVDITGVRHGGKRFYVTLKDRPGVTGEVLDIVKKNGFTLDSVLTTYEGTRKGFKRVVVRTMGKPGNVEAANMEIEKAFGAPFM